MEVTNLEQQILNKIGFLLFKKRQEQGISVRELKRRSGVSLAVITDLERAQKLPTIRIIIKLFAALDVSTNEVLSALATSESPKKQSIASILSDYGYNKDQIMKILDYAKYVRG